MLTNNILSLIFFAICGIESNHNINAIGDNGRAFGVAQIHEAVIIDVNSIYKTEYNHIDAFDPIKSKEIFIMYVRHWSNHYKNKTGKEIDIEVIVRIWNGGPNWFMKSHLTDRYWNEFQYRFYKREE